MTKRQQQAENTRRKLLESAHKLIEKKGFESVTVDEIVQDCAVAKGTFYHYFKSKDELMEALGGSVYEHIREVVLSDPSLSSMERLKRLIRTWYQELKEVNLHLARYSLQQYMNKAPKDRDHSGMSQMDEGMDLIRRLLCDGIDRGELKPDTPADILSTAFMFSLQGSAQFHCKQEEHFDIDAWCDAFLHYIVEPILSPYLT